jgi:hypothetical protein
MTSINLTVKQIMDLANYAGLSCSDGGMDDGDLEYELTIVESGLVAEDDDKKSAYYGAYAYMSEYPEEGCYPLNENIISGGDLEKAKESLKQAEVLS